MTLPAVTQLNFFKMFGLNLYLMVGTSLPYLLQVFIFQLFLPVAYNDKVHVTFIKSCGSLMFFGHVGRIIFVWLKFITYSFILRVNIVLQFFRFLQLILFYIRSLLSNFVSRQGILVLELMDCHCTLALFVSCISRERKSI